MSSRGINKKDSAPLVSVIITNYNYEKFIGEAIESVLNQNYGNIELIIIDDGSTDNSRGVISGYTEKSTWIRPIYQDNSGVVAARNIGIQEAKGEFLIFLDADDRLPAQYVRDLVSFMDKNLLDIVYTDVRMFGSAEGVSNFPEYNLERLKNHNFIHVSSLIRRSSIGDTRFDEHLSNLTHEDWDFFLSLCLSGAKAEKCDSVSLDYRIHHSSRNNKKETQEDKKRYVDTYSYIIRKYTKTDMKSEFEYLSGLMFANWYTELYEEVEIMNAYTTRAELQVKEKERQIQEKDKQISSIIASRSYRMTLLISKCLRPVRRAVDWINKLLEINKNRASRFIEKVIIRRTQLRLKSYMRKHNYAVIVHLFYSEMWEDKFKGALEALYKISPFDLYVNIPNDINQSISMTVSQAFPDVFITKLPNRGRDVMPFTITFNAISDKEYDGILKLHTKKSTHTKGGSRWLDNTMESLIPQSREELDQVLGVLKKSKTLIGPRSTYISLSTYLSNNKKHLDDLMDGRLSSKISVDTYGFFAGTMFWISGEYPYIDSINIDKFEDEAGQTDGTYAHAIERYISIKPQIAGGKVFGINKERVVSELTQKSIRTVTGIDDWEYFIDEK